MKLRLWRRRETTPGPVNLKFQHDPGITLELRRPIDATPGPVSLQFGRYEPPEYPTITGEISAALPAAALPGLTLSAAGDSAAAPITGALYATIPAASLPSLTLEALDQTLQGTLYATIPAATVGTLTLAVSASYLLDLPDNEGPAAGTPWKHGQPRQARLHAQQQEMIRTQRRLAPRQTQAEQLGAHVSLTQQQAEKLRASNGVPHQHGERIGTASRQPYAESERIRRASSAAHQHGERIGTASRQPCAETIKLRATTSAAHQHGERIAGTITIRSRQGAPIALGLRIRETHAIPPPPGRATWEITDPTTPDTSNIILQFCKLWDGSTTLVFRKCEHDDPEPGGTIIIPVQEVYTVINTLTITELDGTPISAEDFSAQIDADSWAWSWSARIPATALQQVRPDSSTRVEVVATINGEPLRLLVENIQRERRYPESWLRVSGRGRAAFIADPLSPVIQYTNDTSLTAQQALNQALTVNGVPIGWALDWQIEDWQLPAGIWSHNGTYMDAVLRIAEAGGAYVQGHDTDPTLRILPRYPAAPWNWSGETPDIQLPEDVVEVEGIEWRERPDYNAVWVHGGDQGRADRIIRTGSGGTRPAPTIIDNLATDAAMTRQRGLALLGDTGKQAIISLRLPVLAATGLIRPGKFVEYHEQGNTRRGLVRSLSVSHAWPELWQTIGVETHE